MVKTFIIIITIVVLIGIFQKFFKDFLLKIKTNKGLEHYPYGKEKSLLSQAERSFLNEIDQIINKNYRIFSKVRLADVIKVKENLSNNEWQSAFNRIQSKHLDFLICNREDLSIFGAIELDDKSHSLPKRRERDIFINSALQAAGVPILRYPLKRKLSPIELTQKLTETFGPEIVSASAKPVLLEDKTGNSQDGNSRISELVVGDHGYCPVCSGKLEKRKIVKGQHAGKFVLMCSNYPECRHQKPYNDSDNVFGEQVYPTPKFKF